MPGRKICSFACFAIWGLQIKLTNDRLTGKKAKFIYKGNQELTENVGQRSREFGLTYHINRRKGQVENALREKLMILRKHKLAL
jgi:hypothetical protein